jgi:hypothetical protein
MQELKKAFEGKNPGVTINLTSGVSRQLAERILKGDTCAEKPCVHPSRNLRTNGAVVEIIGDFSFY